MKSKPHPIATNSKMNTPTSITVPRRFARSSARKSDAAGIADSGARRQTQVDLRYRLILGRALEIFGALEAEIRRDDVARELFGLGVERQHRVVVSLSREGDLVFGRSEFLLKLHHALVGLELRIVLHDRENLAHARRNLIFRREPTRLI